MLGRQQHAMIQQGDDARQSIAHGDEIDHILVLVQRAKHLDGYFVVVAVQSFAQIVFQRDEMCGAEDKASLAKRT